MDESTSETQGWKGWEKYAFGTYMDSKGTARQANHDICCKLTNITVLEIISTESKDPDETLRMDWSSTIRAYLAKVTVAKHSRPEALQKETMRTSIDKARRYSCNNRHRYKKELEQRNTLELSAARTIWRELKIILLDRTVALELFAHLHRKLFTQLYQNM